MVVGPYDIRKNTVRILEKIHFKICFRKQYLKFESNKKLCNGWLNQIQFEDAQKV